MATILYTTTDAVRSALGATAFDVTDAQMTDRGLERELRVDLNDWLPTHSTIYTEGTTGSPTALQQRKADMLILYSMYFCAYLMALAAPLWAPNQVSDGKNTMKRNALAAKEFADTLLARAGAMKEDILEELGEAGVSPMAFFVGVGDAFDPVTGV